MFLMSKYQYSYISEIHDFPAGDLIFALIHAYHSLYHLVLVGFLPLQPSTILMTSSLNHHFTQLSIFRILFRLFYLFLDLGHFCERFHNNGQK
jgi:hypothetical protein